MTKKYRSPFLRFSRRSPLSFAQPQDWKLPDIPELTKEETGISIDFSDLPTESQQARNVLLDRIQTVLNAYNLKTLIDKCATGSMQLSDKISRYTGYVDVVLRDEPELPATLLLVPLCEEGPGDDYVSEMIKLTIQLSKSKEIVNVHVLFAHYDSASFMPDHILSRIHYESWHFGEIKSIIVCGPATGRALRLELSEEFTRVEDVIQGVADREGWVEEPDFEDNGQNPSIRPCFEYDYGFFSPVIVNVETNNYYDSPMPLEPHMIREFLFRSLVLLSKLHTDYR